MGKLKRFIFAGCMGALIGGGLAVATEGSCAYNGNKNRAEQTAKGAAGGACIGFICAGIASVPDKHDKDGFEKF